jgi:hypothetical protein
MNKRIKKLWLKAILRGIFAQALIFLYLFLWLNVVARLWPNSTMTVLTRLFMLLLIPGFSLFAPEGLRAANNYLPVLLALIFDIAFYSILIYFVLRWRERPRWR